MSNGTEKLSKYEKAAVVAAVALHEGSQWGETLNSLGIEPVHYEELATLLRKSAVRLASSSKRAAPHELEAFKRALTRFDAAIAVLDERIGPTEASTEWNIDSVWDAGKEWNVELREYLRSTGGTTDFASKTDAMQKLFGFIHFMTTDGGKRDFGSVGVLLSTKDGRRVAEAGMGEKEIREVQAEHGVQATADEELEP